MSGHRPTHVPTTLSHAQELGHEVMPGPADPGAMRNGTGLAIAQKKPGDLCYIGLCDPDLHTQVNYYLDANLNCNVAVKAPC